MELQLLLCGKPTIDIQDLRRSTCYKNCTMQSKECRWLFEILAGWAGGDAGFRADRQELAQQKIDESLVCKFIEFVTGCPRAPPPLL